MEEISRELVVDILSKMQFFQGSRGGRELWNEKPVEIQQMDLDSFNEGIRTIRDYILQIEEQAKPMVHCKDCEHWGTGVAGETEHVKCCEYGRYMVGENGYCCYADMRKKVE